LLGAFEAPRVGSIAKSSERAESVEERLDERNESEMGTNGGELRAAVGDLARNDAALPPLPMQRRRTCTAAVLPELKKIGSAVLRSRPA
jgi:hypothetical protein